MLVQVASPSRERVAAYRQLRVEIETTVGRVNGEHGSLGLTPVVYLHQGFTRDEMVALYLAADVLVVTALRDGMNLVAKEYVACRTDELGVLVLSEFAGAANELHQALLVNPHDVQRMKAAFLRAIHMPEKEQIRRMRALQEAVTNNDVLHWAHNFLLAARSATAQSTSAVMKNTKAQRFLATRPILLSSKVEAHLRWFATSPSLVIACDFDGTLAPIVDVPADARILVRAQFALATLQQAQGVQVVLLTGRSVDDLLATGINTTNWIISGSHGAELTGFSSTTDTGIELLAAPLTSDEETRIDSFHRRLTRVFGREPGVRLEVKPFGMAVHTRQVNEAELSDDLLDASTRLGVEAGFGVRYGKQVREFSVRECDKGVALSRIRSLLPQAPVLFFGDDETDEDVFDALDVDDLGVKVGPGTTAALERLPNPETVAAALARLAELRTGTVVGNTLPDQLSTTHE